MDPFNALSTATTARKIPLLKEASPAKVMSCALVASTDLHKDLDAAKEVTEGAGAPSVQMVGRSAMVCGQPVSRDVTTNAPSFPLYPRPWNTPGSCSFPSFDEWEGALIGHAYTSHYGDAHSEEGDHQMSTSGPLKQQ
jgi:hypothetical protein